MMKRVRTHTKINKAKEKWKSPHADAKNNSDEDAKETEKLCRMVNSILDQLTPETFQVLVKLMQKIPIKSETELRGVVDLVYERAVREANTTVVLANACRCLSMLKVPSDSKPGEMVNFRVVLLTRCQREFEKKESIKAVSVSEREETEKAEPEEKREELKQEFTHKVSEANQRKVGNVRFIGMLFKLKMLTENIMHDCMFKLLRTKLPTDLECVCTLLTIIGKELDVAKAKPRMDHYFQEMRKLVSEPSIPSRVRLMLQDVVDLRTDSWVPRRLVKSPKIKGALEAQETTSVSEQVGGRRIGLPRSTDEFDRLNSEGEVEGALRTTPGEDNEKLSELHRGRDSTSGTTCRHSEKKEKSCSPVIRATGSSQAVDGGYRERSHGRAKPEPQPSPIQPASAELKVLSEKDMEKKTKAMLAEYFALQDMEEAILCVQELPTQNHHHFVYNAINHVLERSSQARKQTGHLLHDLVKQSVISFDNYLKGLTEALEFAEDFEIDIPSIWRYFGELISPMVQDNIVLMSFLKQVAVPLVAKNRAGILLAEILHETDRTEELESSSRGDSAPTTPTTGCSMTEIELKLHELIMTGKADNETIFDWIESNVDDSTTKRSKFIRALTTAVCNSAIKGKKGKERVETKEIRARNDLLQKYLDHQADSELQALYAVQELIVKLGHPPGVLRRMLDTLYDEDILSKDAFFQWERSEEEPEGKGVCLEQVIQFFTWLREAAGQLNF